MLNEKQIKAKIREAQNYMDVSKKIFGKEIFQKRIKMCIEGYITALCTVLEEDDHLKTRRVRNVKDEEQ